MEAFLLITILTISSYIDIKHHIVYMPFNIAIVLIGFVYNVIKKYIIIDVLLGYIFIPFILIIINTFKKDSIGDGDIEFISSMGIFLGYYRQTIAFFIGILSLFIYSLIYKKERYALIPFLSFGFIVVLLIFWNFNSIDCTS